MKTLLLLIALTGGVFAQTEQALVDITTGEVIGYRAAKPARNLNPEKWVPVTRNAKPTLDPETHKLVRSVVVAPDKSSVTVSWEAVALTQQELDERAAAIAARDAQAATRKANIEAVMAALKAGTATNAQVQRVVYELAKQQGFSE